MDGQPAGSWTALPSGVTEEALRRAVQTCRSWRGVLRSLGLGSPRTGRQLRAFCDQRGIDHSHFGSRSWTDEQLRECFGGARSWADLTRGLGYAEDSGSARATVRRHLARLGLDADRLSAPLEPLVGDPLNRPVDLVHLRSAGTYLVAAACALAGHRISWPLEPTVYDLLVDTGSAVQRVQVKTTTWSVDGTWACKITHSASSRKAWYTREEIDYFGVVDGDLAVYLIPVDVLTGLGTIYVRRYQRYRTGPVVATG